MKTNGKKLLRILLILFSIAFLELEYLANSYTNKSESFAKSVDYFNAKAQSIINLDILNYIMLGIVSAIFIYIIIKYKNKIFNDAVSLIIFIAEYLAFIYFIFFIGVTVFKAYYIMQICLFVALILMILELFIGLTMDEEVKK